MAAASLVLGITALVFSVIPLVYTQLIGAVLGIIALVMGLWARKHAVAGETSTLRSSIAGMATGAAAALLGLVFYALVWSTGSRFGDEIVRKVGSEFQHDSERGTKEFRDSVAGALDRARNPSAPENASTATNAGGPRAPGAQKRPK